MPYIGQLATLPAGLGTLISDGNPSRGRYFDLIVAEGIVSERGFWEPEPGAVLYPANALTGVVINALADYWTSESVQRLLAIGNDGKLYKSSGGNFSALTMATTMGDHPGSMIVVGGQEVAGNARKAFAFDGGHTKIQTLSGDGSSTTNFGNNWNTTTNIPADWSTNPPRGGVIHKERLWAWAPANAPHNIYASKLGDHENFKNAVGGQFEYVQAIGTGCGLNIAAAVSFKGMLFVFKFPRGIYFLDDTDVDYLNWRWNLVSEAVGVANSPFAAFALDDDVLFVSPDGHIQFLSAVTQQGVTSADYTASSNLQKWTRDNINLDRLNQLSSTWYPAKKTAHIGFCQTTATINNLRLMIDFSNADQENQTARVSYSFRDKPVVLALRRDSSTSGFQRPIMSETDANGDGQVWLLDQESKAKAGFVPTARFQYNRTDFSHLSDDYGNRRKLFDALTVQFKPVGTWDLSVDTVIDGQYHETLHFSMGGAISAFPMTFPFTLGGGSVTTTRRRMTGHGYWLSLAGYVTGAGQDFQISKLTVNMRLGGEEQRK